MTTQTTETCEDHRKEIWKVLDTKLSLTVFLSTVSGLGVLILTAGGIVWWTAATATANMERIDGLRELRTQETSSIIRRLDRQEDKLDQIISRIHAQVKEK